MKVTQLVAEDLNSSLGSILLSLSFPQQEVGWSLSWPS